MWCCRPNAAIRSGRLLSSKTPALEKKSFIFSERVLTSAYATPQPTLVETLGPTISHVTPMPRVEFEARFQGAQSPLAGEAIDLKAQLVTPAFVNSHTHLPMAALRGIEGTAAALSGNVVADLYFTVEKEMEEADVRAFARMGCYESLLNGVGFVWEHYYHGKALAEALVDTGLAGIVAPTLQDRAGPGVPLLEAALQETMDIDDNAQLRGRGIGAAVGPHATDTVSEALWRRCGDLARARGLPLHAHVGQFADEYAQVQREQGCSPVAWLGRMGLLGEAGEAAGGGPGFLLVHGQWASRRDLALLDPARHVPVLCPHSHLRFAFPARLDDWRAAGLRVAVATDAAASNDGMCVQVSAGSRSQDHAALLKPL